MILKKDILLDSNPLLRQKSEEVTLPLSSEDEKTLQEMLEYLQNSQNEELAEKYNLQPGVGLAAPQIGILKKMFAVSTYDENGQLHQYALVNPQIISNSVTNCYLTGGEGCLSVPKTHDGFVKRSYKIKIKAYDYITKQDVLLKLKGYIAIVVQHEYDHLFGKLYYDRINQKNPFEVTDDEIAVD